MRKTAAALALLVIAACSPTLWKTTQKETIIVLESEWVDGYNAAVRQFGNQAELLPQKTAKYTTERYDDKSYAEGYHKALQLMQDPKCTR